MKPIRSRKLDWARRTARRAAGKLGIWLENASLTAHRESSLVILDDAFPNPLSAFRIAEFESYLRSVPGSRIYSSPQAFGVLGETRSFEHVVRDYLRQHPELAGKVHRFDPRRRLRGELGYTLFLNNAVSFVDILERDQIPFVFTLYPGGGFELDQKQSDDKLRRVCSSPLLRRVIVTQKISREYLLDGAFLGEEKTSFIYGGAFPAHARAAPLASRSRYGKDKTTFDVCFVAFKYTPRGQDKGYDVFVRVAEILRRSAPDFRFHVVGTFDASDVDVSALDGTLTFHGTRSTNALTELYGRMDVILSPNVPFVRGPGDFDGFPTGACMEAGLSGVAVFCTDPLKQNVAFEDGRELVIVPNDAKGIAEVLLAYHANPEALRELAGAGQRKFREVLGIETQMEARLRLLAPYLSTKIHVPRA